MSRPEFMPLVPVQDPSRSRRDFGQRMLEMLANEDDFPPGPLLDQSALQKAVRRLHRQGNGDPRSTTRRGRGGRDERIARRKPHRAAALQRAGSRRRGSRLPLGPGIPRPRLSDAQHRHVPHRSGVDEHGRLRDPRLAPPSLFGNVRYFIALVRALRRERPAAVIMHGDLAQVLGAPAALLAGVRQRIVVNHLAIGIFYKWLRPVHTVMGVLGFYKHIVFVGDSARRDADGLPRRFLERSTVIANTVGPVAGDRAAARSRYGIPADTTVLLNVGNLSEQKNQQISSPP